MQVVWNPAVSHSSMEQMKPTVPHTRMGGNAFTVSSPFCSKTQ